MDGSNEGVLKWFGNQFTTNLTRFSSSYDLEAAESEPPSPAGASSALGGWVSPHSHPERPLKKQRFALYSQRLVKGPSHLT